MSNMTQEKSTSPNKQPMKKAPFAETVSSIRHQITDHPGRNLGLLAAAASISAGAYGLSTMEGGNDNGAERGEVDQSIYSLTLSPDANLRYDPNMGNDDNNTLIGQPGEETLVVSEDGIRVLDDTNNGTWYGIDSSKLAEAIPNFNNRNDKDGIIWVNEQGVTHITHLEDVDIQLPDTPAYNDEQEVKKS